MASQNTTTAGGDGTGQPPDLSRGPAVLAVTIIFTCLSFAFVVLRTISRIFVVGRWKWDDWLIVAAWILAFGFSFSICWGVHSGLGRHSDYITQQNHEQQLRQSEYVFSILYNPVLMCTKTSICLFYLSIAKNQTFFKWGVYATLAVVNLAGLALTLVNAFQCHPPSALVQAVVPQNAVCIDILAIYLASSPVNIITDLALLLLPMPMLTAMRMPRKQKIILIVTFGFGLFVAVVDIVRIAYLQEAFEVRVGEVSRGSAVTSELLNESDDFPWYAAYSFMWSAIEVHVGIMCANVPGLKPLAARLLPTMLYDSSSQIELETWKSGGVRNLLRSCLCFGGQHRSPPETPPSRAYRAYYANGSARRQSDEKRSNSGTPLNPIPDLKQVGSHDFASGSENLPSPLPPALLSDKATASNPAPSEPSSSGSTQQPGYIEDDQKDDHPMDFMEFITTPEMPRSLTRQATAGTAPPASPLPDTNATFYDFYNIATTKTMTELSTRESILPVALVTILFFLWGFAYGLLEQLNNRFAQVAGLNTTQTVALHSAYYGAYFFAAPTVGQLVLRKAGFKMTFICGLCIYSVGTLIFWPSAVLTSYPAFLISNFIVGFGVSILEVGANPFVALCGPTTYAETRLNISQGVQGIGTVIAPLLAQKVLFVDVQSEESFVDVQWTYLAIALFDVALAVVFYYLPIPEAEDGDFESSRLHSLPEDKRISADDRRIPRSTYVTFSIAVVSMFAYLGIQEVVNTSYQGYIAQVGATTRLLQPFDWQTLGYTTFAIGRFATAGATCFIQPWIVLAFLYACIIVFAALAMGLGGVAGGAMLVIFELFQGGIFPIIFAMGLRGLGKDTKLGAVALTAAISGGSIWSIGSAAISVRDNSYMRGLSVGIAAAALGFLYPLYVGLNPTARHMVDTRLGNVVDKSKKDTRERHERHHRHRIAGPGKSGGGGGGIGAGTGTGVGVGAGVGNPDFLTAHGLQQNQGDDDDDLSFSAGFGAGVPTSPTLPPAAAGRPDDQVLASGARR